LADLLRTGMLRPVYHGEHGLRTLRELGRSYQTISQDLNRLMRLTRERLVCWASRELREVRLEGECGSPPGTSKKFSHCFSRK